ncbi:MAG: hypothetical protein ACM36C_17460 [Acidobacteriota bacterium]
MLSAVVLLGLVSAPQTPGIMGRWEGTSICTRIPENAACHDEVVVYDFRLSKDKPGAVTLDAKKIVNGKPEPMYELDFAFDETHHQWSAEFSNTRVHIRWSYTVEGDSMTGTCVLLPSETVVRNVNVKRAVSGKQDEGHSW